MDSTSRTGKAFKSLVATACHKSEEFDHEKEMMETLRKMMNNTEYSDLVFVCSDGVCMYASRLWLCARSLVFLKGLSPGIQEITLDDISSPVMSIVFEFFYTGSVQSYRSHIVKDEMERWSKGLETIRAARYLLLPDLEKLIWNSLIMDVYESVLDKELTTTSVRLSTLRKLISEYDSSSQVEIAISLELVRILDRGWLGMMNLTNLSQEALLFLLENTQSNFQTADDDVISLREYLRLRQVLLWCVSQRLDVDSALKTLDECLPGAEPALQLLKEADNPHNLDRPPRSRQVSDAVSVLIQASVSCGFKPKLFPLISLRLIHPILLVKVLEPLKIIPCSKFMEAFRFHALKRLFTSRTLEYTWKHSGFFKVLEEGSGSTLEKIQGPSGTAVVSSPAFWQDRLYKWNVIIDVSNQKRGEFQWEIGMLMSDTYEISSESLTNVLSDLDNGWALRRNSEGKMLLKQPCLSKEQPTSWMFYATDPGSDAEKDSSEIHIRIHLNMFNRTCSFSLNEVDYGHAWIDLPRKYYFPAVSFCRTYSPETEETSHFGRARVELLDGFEFEQELNLVRKKPRSVSSRDSDSCIILENGPDAYRSENIEVASAFC